MPDITYTVADTPPAEEQWDLAIGPKAHLLDLELSQMHKLIIGDTSFLVVLKGRLNASH